MAFDAFAANSTYPIEQSVNARRLPRIYGLVVALGFSMAAWAGLAWAAFAVYGLFR